MGSIIFPLRGLLFEENASTSSAIVIVDAKESTSKRHDLAVCYQDTWLYTAHWGNEEACEEQGKPQRSHNAGERRLYARLAVVAVLIHGYNELNVCILLQSVEARTLFDPFIGCYSSVPIQIWAQISMPND